MAYRLEQGKPRYRQEMALANGSRVFVESGGGSKGTCDGLVHEASTFPLAEAARAHEATVTGHTRGKIVLTMSRLARSLRRSLRQLSAGE
jgi:hypothetical protein